MGKKNKDFSLMPSVDNASKGITNKGITKKGTFEEGVNGYGNPYRNQKDELTGIATEETYLHDGTHKVIVKIPPKK